MKPTMKQIAYLSALADRLHVRAPRVRTRGEATAAIADMKDRLAQRSFRFTPARRGGPDPDGEACRQSKSRDAT